jgi:hypothetical protein
MYRFFLAQQIDVEQVIAKIEMQCDGVVQQKSVTGAERKSRCSATESFSKNL